MVAAARTSARRATEDRKVRIAGRPLRTLLAAPLQGRHYVALAGMVAAYPDLADVCGRYLLGWGAYPASITVRTPLGRADIRVHSFHDLLTINEIFARKDYPARPDIGVVVDIGSNIGISALYFLTRNRSSKVFLFEPLPRNVDALKSNLSGYEARYVLDETAIGTGNGMVEFGWEDTGRYGGIGRAAKHRLDVRCRDINDVLRDILREVGEIDVLKMDVEGSEEELLRHASLEHLRRIRAIYAECDGRRIELPGFRHRQYGSVARFFNLQA
jgi:FkbM family methyltransferase